MSISVLVEGTSAQRLPSAQLVQIAQSWVARLGDSLHRGPSDERWYCRLTWNEAYEVWLEGWSGSQKTEMHDHGGSSGAVVVAAGTLAENRFDPASGSLQTRLLSAGATISFDEDVVHDIVNADVGPSLSIHVYSPPLSQQTYYDVLNGKISERETLQIEPPDTEAIAAMHRTAG